MARTRKGLKKAYPKRPRRPEWHMCFGHDLNKCGWKLQWPAMWCEDCWEDYLSDPDAWK